MEKINKNLIYFLIIAAIFCTGAAFSPDYAVYLLSGLLLLLLIIFFIRYPEIGIYLMIFLYPFNYFEFYYGSIDVPYADMVGLILFVSWVIKTGYLLFTRRERISLKNFPGWAFMLLFVLSAVLSLINVDQELLTYSIKYILRPILFFYLIFVILPFNIINTEKKLFTAFKVMYALGITLSLMGIWSLIFPPIVGLRRVVPISIFGIYPLGTNHNLFAEIFVCLIPVAMILFWQENKSLVLKNFYLMGALLMSGVNLLTLSRGGWLALFSEFIILIAIKYRKEVAKYFTNYLFYLALALSTPILYLMYQLLTSYVVVSSNLNRLKLIDIAWNMFQANPIIGHGIGSFTVVVSGVQWYIIEYGGPLDAHGFLFKTLAEIGILGTICFVSLLLYYLSVLALAYKKSQNKDYNWVIIGMLLAVIGCIIFQFFGTGYYIAKLWLPIGIAVASLKVYGLRYVKS